MSHKEPADPSPPTPRRRGRPRLGKAVARDLSRDEEILKIAAEVVWQKGFSGTKLSDIAAAAGIVKGSLYHYFDSKEEIYDRILANVRGMLAFDPEFEGEAPAVERLERYVRRHLGVIFKYPLEMSLLVRDLVRMKGPTGDWAREGPLQRHHALRQLILQGQAEGSFRAVDADLVASAIQGIFSHIPNWYRRAEHADAETLTSDLTEYVLSGLLKHARAAAKKS